MVSNFFSDLKKAHKAEIIVRDAFAALTDEYSFYDVSGDREYYHKGDIKSIDDDGNEIMIEVKDDSRIAETRNVLCEEFVTYTNGDFHDGNMYSDYEIYCVLSQAERKIYVIDFSILKAHYKTGHYKVIPHPEQTTYCYLCSLGMIERWGALITVVDYVNIL